MCSKLADIASISDSVRQRGAHSTAPSGPDAGCPLLCDRRVKVSFFARDSYDCAHWMSAIQVVVRPRPETAPTTALAPLYGLFDVIIVGVNITARLGEVQALALLSDLGSAVSS